MSNVVPFPVRERGPAEGHFGGPDCDACEGTGCDETASDVPGEGYECGDCNGTGETEWRPFDPNQDADICATCFDARGDQRIKPVTEDAPFGGCGDAFCAACYQTMHDEKCGCGAAVATPEQIADAKGGAS